MIFKSDKERVDIRIPKTILKKADKYHEGNGITTRTATILELLRKGMEK